MDRYGQFRRAAIDRDIPDDEVDKFADQLRFAVWAGVGSSDGEVVGHRGGRVQAVEASSSRSSVNTSLGLRQS
ncbi:hypothetical protein Q5530_33545, partial [Saccharothrix sp. BKS2]|uniref:hypothetical protein n=1 Tax=Saccharothrix sp. BKS2 TaxID=3064400 RepID=UPI0039E8C919